MAFNKKEIKIPIYTGTLVLINTDSVKKLQKIIKNWGNDKDIYATSTYFDLKGKHGYGIVLNFNNKTDLTHGTIAHECYHICSIIMDIHGIKPDFNNDEPMAYLVDWLVDQCYIFFKENGLEPKTLKS